MEESRLWGSQLGCVNCKSRNLLQPSLGITQISELHNYLILNPLPYVVRQLDLHTLVCSLLCGLVTQSSYTASNPQIMTRGPLGTKGRAEGLLCFTNVVHPRLRTERAHLQGQFSQIQCNPTYFVYILKDLICQRFRIFRYRHACGVKLPAWYHVFLCARSFL